MEIIDYLLARKKAGGGSDVTIEQLTATENGTYSEEGKAYSPVVVNVPAPENSYQLKDTPSGTVSTIDDGTAFPMPSLKVGIEPQQDLHGYDHPWAGGAGKNKIPPRNDDTISTAELTITIKDGIITVNGTASGNGQIRCSEANFQLPAGTYTASYGNNMPYLHLRNITDGVDINTYTFTLDSTKTLQMYFDYATGITYNNIVIKPQIELGSTATSYEPYSNICPISGWNECNVMRTGKNLFDESILLECTGWTVSDGVYSGSSGYIHDKYNNGVPNLAFKPNTQYTFSFTYDQDGSIGNALVVIIRYTDGTITPKYCTLDTVGFNSIISTEGKSIAKLELSYGSNRTIHLSNMQLEEGSTATTYEPYNGTTYTIQFRDGDNPLTVYGGTLDATSGELVVDRAMLTIDENSNVAVGGFKMNFKAKAPEDAKIFSSSSLWGSKCNMMTEVIQQTSWGIPATYSFTGNLKQIYFKLTDDLTDVDELKAFLTENPIKICYILDEPITYQLTPTQIRTLVGNNNIWADTGNIIEGKYFKSLS